MSGNQPSRVTVIGEALIDLVPEAAGTFGAHPGGSPFNVAVGLARLGVPTALMARLADNAFGRVLRRHALDEGIDLTAAPLAGEPTTLAVVSFDDQARPSYDFYFEGMADWQWKPEETERIPEGSAVFHFGSIASWTPPGDEQILALASRLREAGEVLISYDPNIRSHLLDGPAQGRAKVESCVGRAHLAKASAEDLAWLYPGEATSDICERWLGLGAELVVVTDGPNGASARTRSGLDFHRPGIEVVVADTVGAGDAFTAGLLASLVSRDLESVVALAAAGEEDLIAAVEDAVWVSAVTCERAGADPPRPAEVSLARARLGGPS